MGRFKNKVADKLCYYAELYPDLDLGVWGTVNQDQPPLCVCGKSQILLIWFPKGIKRICLECDRVLSPMGDTATAQRIPQ
ncbi:hypothetical protein AB3R30_18900 [Leptolyngbyaceae cyanobacterium UHCC 1019]